MKLKNLNFIELHLEKFIVALATIIFLVVVWQYILGDPYAVTIDQIKGVGPNQVETMVLHELSLLRQKIESGTPSPLPEMSVPAYTALFRQRLERSPLPIATLDPLGQLGLAIIDGDDGGDDGIDRVSMPPSPVRVRCFGGFGVLLGYEQLAEGDASWPSEALSGWNAQDVAKAYDRWISRQQPRDFRYVTVAGLFDAGAWRKMQPKRASIPLELAMALVDVVLERQAFDPVQGQWQPETAIDPLPGVLSFRDRPTHWTTNQAQQVLQQINSWQDQIARPPFAPMTDAAAWKRPEIADSGVSEDEHGVEPAGGASMKPVGSWAIWAHDLTVQPGVTYRYRLSVWTVNPLFQKPQLKGDLREQYFHTLAVRSQNSSWTEPITIEPLRQFFVVGGSGAEREATVEVWRVFNGRPRVSEFKVHPGDFIGQEVLMKANGVGMQVDMSVNALAVDMIDTTARRGAQSRSTLLYVALETNQLLERSIEADRNSPARVRLIDQASVDVEP